MLHICTGNSMEMINSSRPLGYSMCWATTTESCLLTMELCRVVGVAHRGHFRILRDLRKGLYHTKSISLLKGSHSFKFNPGKCWMKKYLTISIKIILLTKLVYFRFGAES